MVQANSVHFIPWKDCFLFLPVVGNEGAPYMLLQRSLTRRNWEQRPMERTRGCQSAGEARQREMPAGRDGLTMSFA